MYEHFKNLDYTSSKKVPFGTFLNAADDEALARTGTGSIADRTRAVSNLARSGRSLAQADLSELDLTQLQAAKVDMRGARTSHTKFGDISGWNLEGSHGNGMSFNRANGTNFAGSVQWGLYAPQAELRGADMKNILWVAANLCATDQRGAQQQDAAIVFSNEDDANISGADRTGVDLSWSSGNRVVAHGTRLLTENGYVMAAGFDGSDGIFSADFVAQTARQGGNVHDAAEVHTLAQTTTKTADPFASMNTAAAMPAPTPAPVAAVVEAPKPASRAIAPRPVNPAALRLAKKMAPGMAYAA